MDQTSNSSSDYLAMKKQLTVYLSGSSQNYENYKRTQEIHSYFPNDLDYYNDTFYYRHERNLSELKKIKSLLKQKIIKPEMLIYNTWNSFYPSYILHHHIFIYTHILNLFKSNNQIQTLIQKAQSLSYQGTYLQKIINIDFQRQDHTQKPTLNQKNHIQMEKSQFFFDKHVSLYFHVACFIAIKSEKKILVFVKLRQQNGELCKQITVKDLGERISTEYLQIAYNFNNVKPFLAIQLNDDSKIQNMNNMNYFYESTLSLLDLKKSLYIAIKYTSMREQFKTLPGTKKQRTIITYQAVGSRIINAFAKFVCFSQTNRSLTNNIPAVSFIAPFLDINNHLILESIIKLRECCGGFGYLQVAGHGSGIQRVSLRASEAVSWDVPENPQILKRLHYYSSSDDMQQYFGDMLTKQTAFNPSQVFAVFINICVNMRKYSSQLMKQIYLRHFMHQAAIQTLKSTEQFSRLPIDSIFCQILSYQTANYIIDNSQFINWKFIQNHLSREEYYQGLLEFRNNYLNQLLTKMPLILEILEVSYLRNVIIGREDKEQFYHQVFQSARKNLRNSQQFASYVKRPIIDFLHQNNKAKL